MLTEGVIAPSAGASTGLSAAVTSHTPARRPSGTQQGSGNQSTRL